MKAVRAQRAGGPEVLLMEEVPTPAPAEGQVLIKLKAAGVNYAEIGMRLGIYARSFPAFLGLEGAGVIESVGKGVDPGRIGQRVLAYSLGGSYAEYAVTAANMAFPYPASLKAEEAACVGVTYMTAWHCLITHGQAHKGEWVLVHAAGSGVGVASTQIARHLGMQIIATASTDEKLAKAKVQGAHEVINYAQKDFVAETLRVTGGKGVDMVLDGIGGETLLKSLGCLAMNGRLINYGKTSGNEKPALDPSTLWQRNLTIKGVSVQSNSREPLREVLSLMEQGKLKPVIDKVYALKDTAEAHRYVEGRKVFGKVALTI